MTLYDFWKKENGSYADGVALLEEHAPKHALLPMLRSGDSSLNELYLRGALAGVAFSPPHPPPGGTPPSTVHRPPSAVHRPESLYERQRELMTARAKLRNSYHQYGLRTDVPAVQARRKTNQDLIAIRAELHDVSRKIEHYEKTGELVTIPDIVAMSPFEGGKGDDDMQALLNARSNVSRYKKKVAALYKKEAAKADIEAAELKLREWETRRDLIEEKLK